MPVCHLKVSATLRACWLPHGFEHLQRLLMTHAALRTMTHPSPEEKIRELISALDMRKDEAIERTFKGVAKNFREVRTRGGGVNFRGMGGTSGSCRNFKGMA